MAWFFIVSNIMAAISLGVLLVIGLKDMYISSKRRNPAVIKGTNDSNFAIVMLVNAIFEAAVPLLFIVPAVILLLIFTLERVVYGSVYLLSTTI